MTNSGIQEYEMLELYLTHQLQLSERLGISRKEAADIIGVSASMFDRLVADGTMPAPVRLGSRKIWNRLDVEKRFAHLSSASANEAAGSSWDDVLN